MDKKPAATHTPTPWKVILNDSGITSRELIEIRIPEEFGRIVAFVPWPNKSDAAFIVRAVNTHEELLNQLKDALEVLLLFTRHLDVAQKRVLEYGAKAIAKAEGR